MYLISSPRNCHPNGYLNPHPHSSRTFFCCTKDSWCFVPPSVWGKQPTSSECDSDRAFNRCFIQCASGGLFCTGLVEIPTRPPFTGPSLQTDGRDLDAGVQPQEPAARHGRGPRRRGRPPDGALSCTQLVVEGVGRATRRLVFFSGGEDLEKQKAKPRKFERVILVDHKAPREGPLSRVV